MSEQKPRYMQQLDEWTENEIIHPLHEGFKWEQDHIDLTAQQELDDHADEVIAAVKKAVREKVLESYRNGQKAGPPRAQGFQNKQQK